MSERLIKNIAVDILCLTTLWSLLNNPYTAIRYYTDKTTYLPTVLTGIGVGVSMIVINKYL